MFRWGDGYIMTMDAWEPNSPRTGKYLWGISDYLIIDERGC